ncbi:MAG: Calx-beta domain-containing protein, partial [Pseudomonadota bacterium]
HTISASGDVLDSLGNSSRAFPDVTVTIRPEDLPPPVEDLATITARVDDAFDLYVNGKLVLSGDWWLDNETAQVALEYGDVIAIDARDVNAGAVAFVDIVMPNGERLGTSSEWLVSTEAEAGWREKSFDDSAWTTATEHGDRTLQPWFRGDKFDTETVGHWIWTDDIQNDDQVFFRYTVGGVRDETADEGGDLRLTPTSDTVDLNDSNFALYEISGLDDDATGVLTVTGDGETQTVNVEINYTAVVDVSSFIGPIDATFVVVDDAGNLAVATAPTVSVVDGRAPTGVFYPVEVVDSASEPFTLVARLDDRGSGVDPATIDETILRLLTRNGSVDQTASSIERTAITENGSVEVSFVFDPPEGGWPAGQYIASIPENSFTDRAGNGNTEVFITDFAVTSSGPAVFLGGSTQGYEGGRAISILAELTMPPPEGSEVIVTYETFDTGSATPGVDFDDTGGQIVIPSGWFANEIFIDVFDDRIVEGAETFGVRITGATMDGVPIAIGEGERDDIKIGAESIARGTTGDDVVRVSRNDEIADLTDGGADELVLAKDQLDALVVQGFGEDDTLTVENALVATSVAYDAQSETLLLDTVGDGVADRTVVFEGLGAIDTRDFIPGELPGQLVYEPLDRVAPTAVITPVDDLVEFSGPLFVEVRYTDDEGFDLDTIDPADLQLSGRSNSINRLADGVSLSVVSETGATAIYRFDEPSEGWVATGYTLNVLEDRLADLAGNAPEVAQLDRFTISVSDGPQDTTAPTVETDTIADIDDVFAPVVVTVRYSDEQGMDIDTIDRDDVVLTSGWSTEINQLASSAQVDATDAREVVVTYTFNPPSDGWPEGRYQFRVLNDRVADLADNTPGNSSFVSFGISDRGPLVRTERDEEIDEVNGGTAFAVAVSHSSYGRGDVMIEYEVVGLGGATEGFDFASYDELENGETRGTLIIPDGETFGTVYIRLLNDSDLEIGEAIEFRILSATIDGSPLEIFNDGRILRTFTDEEVLVGTVEDDVLGPLEWNVEGINLTAGGADLIIGSDYILDTQVITGFGADDTIRISDGLRNMTLNAYDSETGELELVGGTFGQVSYTLIFRDLDNPGGGVSLGNFTITSLTDISNEITFTPPDQSPITAHLIDAATDVRIGEIEDGDTISADDIGAEGFALDITFDGSAGSVRFFSLDGTLLANENFAPYARFGDWQGDFAGQAIDAAGEEAFTVEVYSGRNGTGELLASDTFAFQLEPAADTGVAQFGSIERAALETVFRPEERMDDALMGPMDYMVDDPWAEIA